MRARNRARNGATMRGRGAAGRMSSRPMTRTDSNVSFSTTDSRPKRGRASSSQELDDAEDLEEPPAKLRRLSDAVLGPSDNVPSQPQSQPSDADADADADDDEEDDLQANGPGASDGDDDDDDDDDGDEEEEEEEEVPAEQDPANDEIVENESLSRNANGEMVDHDDLGTGNASPSALMLEDVPRRGGYANRRGKRRKGWNLRKANKIASGVPMQTTPLRLEDGNDGKARPGGILERLPGRRRVPHADPHIEADMRRQLELKVAYRAVVKVLKPVLAELARRTSDSLEQDPDAHQYTEEYDGILDELDDRLKKRLAALDCWFREENARLQRELTARERIVTESYHYAWDNTYEERLLQAQRDFMSILHQSERHLDDAATDDEGELTGAQYRVNPRTGSRTPLQQDARSRSLCLLLTSEAFDQLDARRRFRDAFRQYAPETFSIAPKSTFYDGEKRRAANARWNVLQLVEAGDVLEDYERRKAQVVTNEQAAGLQELVQAIELAPSMIKSPAPKSSPIVKRAKTEDSAGYGYDMRGNGSLSPVKQTLDKRQSSRETSQASTSTYPPHPNPGPVRGAAPVQQPLAASYEALSYPGGHGGTAPADVQALSGSNPVREHPHQRQQQYQQHGEYPGPPMHMGGYSSSVPRLQQQPQPPPPAPVGYTPTLDKANLAPERQAHGTQSDPSLPAEKDKKVRKRPGPKAHYAPNIPPGMPPPPPGYEYQPWPGYPAVPILPPGMRAPEALKHESRPLSEHKSPAAPPKLPAYAQGQQREPLPRASPKSSLPPLAPAHLLHGKEGDRQGHPSVPPRPAVTLTMEPTHEQASPTQQSVATFGPAAPQRLSSMPFSLGAYSGYPALSQSRLNAPPKEHRGSARSQPYTGAAYGQSSRDVQDRPQVHSPYAPHVPPPPLLPHPHTQVHPPEGGYPPHPHHSSHSNQLHAASRPSREGSKAQAAHSANSSVEGSLRYQPVHASHTASPQQHGQLPQPLMPALNAGPPSRPGAGVLPPIHSAHPGQRLGGHPPLLPASSETPRLLSHLGSTHSRQESATSDSPMSPPPRPPAYGGRAENGSTVQAHPYYSPQMPPSSALRPGMPSGYGGQGPPPQPPSGWPGFAGPPNYPWSSSGGHASSYPPHPAPSPPSVSREGSANRNGESHPPHGHGRGSEDGI